MLLRINHEGMSGREIDALSKVLGAIITEGIMSVSYDSHYDIFYFGSRTEIEKHRKEGYVLSVYDAQVGNFESIHEPPCF